MTFTFNLNKNRGLMRILLFINYTSDGGNILLNFFNYFLAYELKKVKNKFLHILVVQLTSNMENSSWHSANHLKTYILPYKDKDVMCQYCNG